MNNRVLGSTIHLHSTDEITAYCGIPESSSVLDAMQQCAQLNEIHSTGFYTILQRLSAERQTTNQTVTMRDLIGLPLSSASLVDADIFLVCSTLFSPCPSLRSIQLADNQLTDVSAGLLAQWILTNHTPSLTSIDLSRNPWWGDGLRDLFFSLRRYCSIQQCVMKRSVYESIEL